jgi:four helix bundle protein
MFIFEKLSVYQKSLQFNYEIHQFLKENTVDRNINDQLSRAAISIALNVAEGTGRNTKKDKQNFYYNARGSTHECVAILQILNLE